MEVLYVAAVAAEALYIDLPVEEAMVAVEENFNFEEIYAGCLVAGVLLIYSRITGKMKR